MTIPELKDLARAMLDFGIARIRETGELMHTVILVHRDGWREVIINGDAEKRDLARLVKARVAVGDIEAVVMLSDTFTASMTEDQIRTQRRLGLSIEQAGQAGLCKVHECVFASLESPLLYMTTSQEYRRIGKKVEPVGEPVVTSDESGFKFGGQFTGFFRHEALGRTV